VGRRLLGDRLRDLRQETGLTLPQVVTQTGISMSHLSDCERGEKALSLPALFTLADLYGLLITELLDGVYPYGSRQEPLSPPGAR
jgi:transcriptional regulator with XRE-family HTH domain